MKINKRNFLKTTFSIFCAPFVINSKNLDNKIEEKFLEKPDNDKKYVKVIIQVSEDLYSMCKTHFCYLTKENFDYFIKSGRHLSNLMVTHMADCILNVYDDKIIKNRYDCGVKWYEDRVINTIDIIL